MFLVTGGAGFIGSNLVEFLSKKDCGMVLDLNETPCPENVGFLKKDILSVKPKDFEGIETVFHLAADPDVRRSVNNPSKSFDVNVIGSFKVLEAAREAGVKNFIFASSGGTVYGDSVGVVNENSPLKPISPYGASKAAFEMYLSAYAESYGMNCSALRLANVIGPNSKHGVIWDFFWKLKKNPNELKILGNGLQEKSYIHVQDVVNAFIIVSEKTKGFEAYNVSNDGTLSVKKIAELVSSELGLNPLFKFTGGNRGWTGDVKKIVLDSQKIKSLGWKPKFTQEEAVKNYVMWLIHFESNNPTGTF